MKDVRFHIVAIDKTKAVFSSVATGLKNIIGNVLKLTGAFAALATVGIGVMISKSLEGIDNIGKLSKSLGISTEALQTFEYMAKLGGTTLDKFVDSAKDISKNVFEFVGKGTGEASDGFRALGITVEDLKPIMNDQVALMGFITDELNKLPDGAIKTAAAYKLLGGSSVDLLPAIKGGTAAFKEARIEAERFGLILSADAVQGVEDANDSMTKLKALFGGISDSITAALAPGLEFLVDLVRNRLVDAFETSGGSVQTWATQVVVSVVRTVQSAAIAIVDFMGWSIVQYNRLARFIGKEPLGDSWMESLIQFKGQFIVDTDAMIAQIQNFNASMNNGADMFNSETAPETLDALSNMSDGLKAYGIAATNTFAQAQKAGMSSIMGIENALVNFVETGKLSFGSLVKSIIADLARISIQKGITGPLASGLSAVFGGFFADGGRPPVGKPSVVGERGPEIFVPDAAGTVISNKNSFGSAANLNRSDQSGVTNIYNIDARSSTDPEQVKRQVEYAIARSQPSTVAKSKTEVFSQARRKRIA